ncbi:hypothetical protein ACIOJD_26715 [Streptomyces sp. NPDC088116]|uniref:hypothetical protein n=1 Tax=Streptomyces sp. NPDC088116 TaxID=3365825 RepID=UPI003826DD89
MTTATFTPAHAPHDAHRTGASAMGSASHSAASAHSVGNALRALTVFFTAAFSVAVLGEYGEEAGIKRH